MGPIPEVNFRIWRARDERVRHRAPLKSGLGRTERRRNVSAAPVVLTAMRRAWLRPAFQLEGPAFKRGLLALHGRWHRGPAAKPQHRCSGFQTGSSPTATCRERPSRA
jgi:hypothetical protein